MPLSAIKYIYWRFQVVIKLILIIRGVLAFSLQRGVSLWMILEINFISFVGLLGINKESCQKNRAINYFLVQALGRIVMLISLITVLIKSEYIFFHLFFLGLLAKLGGAPFHNWYLKLIQKLSWYFIWVLSCWQKIIPLLLISLSSVKALVIRSCISVVFGRIGAFKQSSTKKIFGLSSIFTLGWILAAIIIDKIIWLYFFVGYSLNLGALVSSINYFFLSKANLAESPTRRVYFFVFFIFLLIIRGIPPFLGFFLKLIVLFPLTQVSLILALVLVVFSLFIIFIYLIIIFNIFRLRNARNLKITLQDSEFILLPEFIIFNFLIVFLLINFYAYDLYHISNKITLRLKLR